MTVSIGQSSGGPPPSPSHSSGSDTDLLTSASTALRRLNFKAARHARNNKPNVPKVVVMGSSTTSEATINTSTDSASTLITNMTATTDGGDSLDLIGSLPMDNNAATTSTTATPSSTSSSAASTAVYTQSCNNSTMNGGTAVIGGGSFDEPTETLLDSAVPPTPATALPMVVTAKSKSPPMQQQTAQTPATRFPFDVVVPSNEQHTPRGIEMKEVFSPPITMRKNNQHTAFPFDTPDVQRHAQFTFDCMTKTQQQPITHYNKKEHHVHQHHHHVHHHRQNGIPSPSPKDHNYINHHNQAVTNIDNHIINHHYNQNQPRQNGTMSPNQHLSSANKDHGYHHNAVGQVVSNHHGEQGQSPQPHRTPSKRRSKRAPMLPDLRVDFFKEREMLDPCQAVSASGGGKTPPDQSRAHHRLDGINVTANPLVDATVANHHNSNSNSANLPRKSPSATIVVQQASLSLDYGQVATVLLKNESDFVSNVSCVVQQQQQPKENVGSQEEKLRNCKRREENMKQLLEVASALTVEELRDFEMRYGSPHHSRSQSVKTPGRCTHLSLPAQRSRVASMPNTGTEEEYYRLRHFSITGKGVVNRGDSLKSRRSRSNNSVASSNSSTEHLTAEARTSASVSLCSSRESSTSQPSYRVLMLGAGAVGKSSLISQFMTSEYLHAYDTSIDDDSGEKSVSVLLGGEESELTFVDIPSSEMSPENCLTSYEVHAYCVVYSTSDRESFLVAEESLQALWTAGSMATRAVILVANKADLARCRAVSTEEGKAMATAYDCKFIETSVGINHNVDELLVGLLSQIRLKLENPEKSRDLFRKRSTRKTKHRRASPVTNGLSPPVSPLQRSGPPTAPSSPRKYRGSRTSASLRVKGLLGRVWARDSKSKSCENLHVL